MQQNCNTDCSGKKEMLAVIDEVSFAVNDILLFLDTHPCNQEAMDYYKKNDRKRRQLLKEYAQNYGPLTVDLASDCEESKWQWVLQPWPWETEGRCC